MNEVLVQRAKKVLYYGIKAAEGDTITYHRMKHFTDQSTSKNPKEYTRQYVDELFEQTDVVGFSPSISYGFDQYKNNAVHDDMVMLVNDEVVGSDAVRPLILVDLSAATATATSAPAVKRDFAVVPDSEGGSLDAYTYTGNFKAKGDKIPGTVTTADGWQTITFAESSKA